MPAKWEQALVGRKGHLCLPSAHRGRRMCRLAELQDLRSRTSKRHEAGHSPGLEPGQGGHGEGTVPRYTGRPHPIQKRGWADAGPHALQVSDIL